jgi:hypothetical protein
MGEQESDTEDPKVQTLEHADSEESFRQLRWTIAVTVIGVALVAYFYL